MALPNNQSKIISTSVRRQALADFLRNARARITPAMAGLPAIGRRRTPGLRREEAAQLCGISVTWYTWIEQGRDVKVSSSVWSSLADTLHLNPTERAYLFELAGISDPDQGKVELASLPAELELCVKKITDPAYILDRYWNILYFNKPFEELFFGWPKEGKNNSLLDFIFLNPKARVFVDRWEQRAKRSVSEFRADVSAYLEDNKVLAEIERLRQQSDVFNYWWERQVVEGREGGVRGFNHPDRGYVEYQQLTYRLATHLDFKLVMLLDAKA
nr:helix-turn-helix transcriptional regulator [Brackiella oedipodis]